MTSNIDPTVPVTGDPTTASVRGNFQVAHDEITALQIATTGAPFVPVAGTTMTGPLYLSQDPTSGRQAVTKDYFDTHAAGGVGGIPEAPSDGVLYGRQSGGWVHAAAPADITAAITAALVPATTTVAGIGTIATSALVNAGTDATAWVTSATLAARLAAALAPYVPLAGSSTITGSLALAPTGAGANSTLTLNRPDGTGLDAIIGQQAGAEYWRINLVDASNNFAIRRTIGASPGPMLTLENATNAATFGGTVGSLTIGPSYTSGTPLALMGAATAVSAASDYLVLAARRRLTADANGMLVDGGQIFLLGPSVAAPNAGAINLAAGTSASGYKSFVFGPDGSLTGPGNASFSGTLASGGTFSVGSGFNVTPAGVVNAAGTATFAGQVTVQNGAYLSAERLVGGSGSSTGGGGALQCFDTNDFIQFSWGTSSGGNLINAIIDGSSHQQLILANSGSPIAQVYYTAGGPVGLGIAANANNGTQLICWCDSASDERIKENIADTQVDALAALLSIPVRAFDYQQSVLDFYASSFGDLDRELDGTAQHVAIGLVAQEVQPHVPEAITITRPMVGGVDTGPLPEDLHSIKRDEFVVYLIRAVQQLAARVATLEGAAP